MSVIFNQGPVQSLVNLYANGGQISRLNVYNTVNAPYSISLYRKLKGVNDVLLYKINCEAGDFIVDTTVYFTDAENSSLYFKPSSNSLVFSLEGYLKELVLPKGRLIVYDKNGAERTNCNCSTASYPQYKSDEFTGSTSLALTLTNDYVSGTVRVFFNGVRLDSDYFTEDGGNSVTLVGVDRLIDSEIIVDYEYLL